MAAGGDGVNGHGATIAKHRLAGQLAGLRGRSGMTVEAAAETAGWPAGRIRDIESNRWTSVPADDVLTLAGIYGAGDPDRGEIEQAAARCQERSWWRDYPDVFGSTEYAGFEDDARAIRGFSPLRVPVQLQTRAYTRAIAEADGMPVEAVQRRKEVLERENPPRFSSVITQAALLYQFGAGEMQDLREQVLHLAGMSRRPNVELRVCVFADGIAAALCNTVSIMSFDDGGDLVWADTGDSVELVTSPEVIASHLKAVGRVRGAALEPAETTRFLDRFAAGMT